MLKKNFWNKKKVLITGIHGFLGSNLCKFLIKKNANVYGLHNFNSKTSLLNFEKINNFNSLNFSIDNLIKLKEFINDNNIDICFHLAAQVEVQKAYKFPYDTFNNNIHSTLNLCEALKDNKRIKSFIFCSTDKVYGEINKNLLPYKEIYQPKPDHPYEVSKLICENIVRTYTENYNLNSLITRSCNLYGPGQLNFSAIIPSLIMTGMKKEKFIPRSNGLLLRDYMFIEDWVNTLINISEQIYSKKPKKLVYNFGTNKPYTVKEISKLILNKFDPRITKNILKLFENYVSKNEINYQSLDSNRAINEFGFKASTSLNKGIDKTINWYKKFIK
tara:strand:+ start:436 stop:1428 length:993 start_codon:yes stop_codon:yes gene_type:complete